MASSFLIYLPYEQEETSLNEKPYHSLKENAIPTDISAVEVVNVNNHNSSNKKDITDVSTAPDDASEVDKDASEKVGLLQKNPSNTGGDESVASRTLVNSEEAASERAAGEKTKKVVKQARFDVTPALSSALRTDGASSEALLRRPSANIALAKSDMLKLQEVTTEVLTLQDVSVNNVYV